MGAFQDKEGSGYVFIHDGEIYKLGGDYKTVSEQVTKNLTSGFEAPAMFRKDSLYYLLGSDLTSWEKNDNYYYTATVLKGPWTRRGLFCPTGTLTWNSQTTFVLPIEGSKENAYLFIGDRWSFPKQASAATYVWQPLVVLGYSLSIPTYREAWQINAATGETSPATVGKKRLNNTDKELISYSGQWRQDTLSTISSDIKNASFSVKFTGTQVGFYGLARPDGGYARVRLQNSKGETVFSLSLIYIAKSDDLVIIPTGKAISVSNQVYTATAPTLIIQVSGELDFHPSGKLDLSATSSMQLFVGGKIVPQNSAASQLILLGGVTKYNASNNGTLAGPAYADALSGSSVSGQPLNRLLPTRQQIISRFRFPIRRAVHSPFNY